MGLLCLSIFWKQESLMEARSLISGLFFVCIACIFGNMMPTILTFQIERPVFLREQANRMYDVVPYYLAKLMIDIPVVGFVQFLFTIIIYFGIGMTVTANQFFIFFAAVYLTGETAASLGYFISSIFQHEETAVELAPIIVMPLILFGGQFSNAGTIQSWISWLQYVSPIRYAFEVLVTNEYDERKYNATMIMRSITNNYTVTVLDAFATSSS